MGRRINRIASPNRAEEDSTLANLVHQGLDRLAQGIAIFDSELRLVLANKRLVDMFGYPPELVEPGTPFADLFRFKAERGDCGPGDVEELVGERVERARKLEPHLFELVRADGTAIEVRSEPLPGGGFVSTFSDITERKRTESAPRKSEEILRGAIESLQEGFALFDADDRIVMINDVYRRINPRAQEFLDSGMRFEDLIRANVERGWMVEARGREEEFIRERVEQHRNPGPPIIRQFGDGKWYILKETQTPEGGIALTFIDITERKLAEDELKASEKEVRNILDTILDTFYRSDREGRIVMASRSAEVLLGYTHDELIGSKLADFYADPRDREEFLRALEKSGGQVVGYEAPLRRKDGSTVWVSTNARYWLDAEGNIAGVEGTTRDITERKQAENALRKYYDELELRVVERTQGLTDTITELRQIEEALRTSEERFRGIAETSPVAMFISAFDDGTILYCNQAAGDLQHVAHQKLIGLKVTELYKDAVDRQALVEELEKHAEVRDLPLEIVTRDGESRWVTLSGRRIPFEGKPAFFSVISDVTDRKRAEEALRESEERFRAGFEHAAAGIAAVDRDRRYLSFNPAYSEMFGYSEEELLAMGPVDITHPDDRANEEASLRRMWKGELDSLRIGKRYLHKNGHVVWADAVISMVRDAQGEPLYTFGQIQDITERKRAEEELRMAMKAAEDANQAKSQFLTSMSHELRTPLNAVLGFGQLLKSGTKAPLNDTQRSHVDHILDGGEHLLNLINQVLDLSKIETGAIPVSIEDVEVADIFEECLVLIEPLTEKYDARVVVEGAKHETTTVRADYTRLKQVMLNLLSNAVKYNRSGGMAILECAKGGRGMARLSVSDTGPGIAKDKQEQLFKPFSRLGAELSNIEGTGVGLILTKQLVELMGGHIGFESEEGKGSTFWIEIPRA
ncbi:MAG: PAS domain S-box protein, partial [Rhodospirillales bacterium]|nr:PAS domain S-box protein [Rhodospirillales bacterium]